MEIDVTAETLWRDYYKYALARARHQVGNDDDLADQIATDAILYVAQHRIDGIRVATQIARQVAWTAGIWRRNHTTQSRGRNWKRVRLEGIPPGDDHSFDEVDTDDLKAWLLRGVDERAVALYNARMDQSEISTVISNAGCSKQRVYLIADRWRDVIARRYERACA